MARLAYGIRYEPLPGSTLPSINEEPLAHFSRPLREEDDPGGTILLIAGTIVNDSMCKDKAWNYRSSIPNEWTTHVKQHNAHPHTGFKTSAVCEEYSSSLVGFDDDHLRSTPPMVTHFAPRHRLMEPTRGRARELMQPPERNKRQRSSSPSFSYCHLWREPS